MLVEIDRPQFNELAEKGTLKSYRRAVETGHIKATGDSNVIKLIAQVVEKQEEREPPQKSALRGGRGSPLRSPRVTPRKSITSGAAATIRS